MHKKKKINKERISLIISIMSFVLSLAVVYYENFYKNIKFSIQCKSIKCEIEEDFIEAIVNYDLNEKNVSSYIKGSIQYQINFINMSNKPYSAYEFLIQDCAGNVERGYDDDEIVVVGNGIESKTVNMDIYDSDFESIFVKHLYKGFEQVDYNIIEKNNKINENGKYENAVIDVFYRCALEEYYTYNGYEFIDYTFSFINDKGKKEKMTLSIDTKDISGGTWDRKFIRKR